MPSRAARTLGSWHRLACTGAASLMLLAFGATAAGAGAKPHTAGSAADAALSPASTAGKAETEPSWESLHANRRTALEPLARDWPTMDTASKKKWLVLADRMPAMSPTERERVKARMAEWTKLSPTQRAQVRMQFQEAKAAAPRSREAQWEAYKALPPEQRQKLAARAATPASAPTPRFAAASRPEAGKPHAKSESRADAKSDPKTRPTGAPTTAYDGKPHAVSPSVMQARPGATTNLMSKRPSPPPYQQNGLPKISATPGFVDSTTLLPQRGPQGVATQAAAASAPITAP